MAEIRGSGLPETCALCMEIMDLGGFDRIEDGTFPGSKRRTLDELVANWTTDDDLPLSAESDRKAREYQRRRVQRVAAHQAAAN